MPRVELPSRQADETPNWVDLKSPDDFMAADLFALHRAVKIRNNASGETEYSPAEMADDRVNAFLGFAVTAWSFPSPIPSQNGVAAADVVIGRTMKARDWAALRKAALPLMDELEGEDRPGPKSGSGTAGAVDAGPAATA
jgi:hypothetical protein